MGAGRIKPKPRNRPAPSISGPATGCSKVTEAWTSWRTHGPASPSILIERREAARRVGAFDQGTLRDLHGHRFGQPDVVAGQSHGRLGRSPRPGPRRRSTPAEPARMSRQRDGGIAETHRQEAPLQASGRREISVAGPRCRQRWTTPCAPKVSFKSSWRADCSQLPMAR